MNKSERTSNAALAFLLTFTLLACAFSGLGCAAKRTTVYMTVPQSNAEK